MIISYWNRSRLLEEIKAVRPQIREAIVHSGRPISLKERTEAVAARRIENALCQLENALEKYPNLPFILTEDDVHI